MKIAERKLCSELRLQKGEKVGRVVIFNWRSRKRRSQDELVIISQVEIAYQ